MSAFSSFSRRAGSAVRSGPALFAFGLLFLGVALTCTPQLADGPHQVATSLPFLGTAPAAAGASNEGALTLLSDTAEAALPAVVNISTAHTETLDEQDSAALNNPFFRHFFGDQGIQGQPLKRRMSAMGSGVIVGSDGIVLTNNHVIDKADEVKVRLSDGREFDAKVVGKDSHSDLAVIQLLGDVKDLPTLPLGNSDALRLGEVVLAVGNPFGLDGTVTMGIVSAQGRSGVGLADYEDYIQTDAAINPGNSGGALVNLQGQLIGINTAIASRSGGYQGIGFAIPTSMARPIMESLLATGTVERGWLGVYIQDLEPDMVQSLGLAEGTDGILVADVSEGSPADKAGLKNGDVITELDGAPMTAVHELRNRVALKPSGKVVKLTYWRGGKEKTMKVTLGTLPEEGVAEAGAPAAGEGRGADGLELAPLTPNNRERYSVSDEIRRGLVVVSVAPGSKAAQAGIQPGDVILEVNRKRVTGVKDFEEAEKEADKALVLLSRGGRSHYLMLG